MSNAMLATILQGRSLVSVYEQIQAELAYYDTVYNRLRNTLIRQYQSDTLDPSASSDSLLILFLSDSSFLGIARAAMEHIERGNSLIAIQLMAGQQGNVSIQDQLAQLQLYLLELIKTKQNNTGWTRADSLSLENLHVIALAK